MRFPALGLFAAAVAASLGALAPGAPVPKHLMKGTDPDLAALQGTWKLTEVAFGGQPLGAGTIDQLEMTLEVRDGAIVFTTAKQNLRTTAAVKIDAAANPKRLTASEGKATDLKGAPVKNEYTEKPSAMIYKIEGDTLVLAATNGDQTQAPKDFDGAGTVSMTFTRSKK